MMAADRCTGSETRVSIRSLTERSISLSGQNPSDQPVSKCHQVRCDPLPERDALSDLLRFEKGLDAVCVNGVGAIRLNRVGGEVRRELHHPGARVLGSLLVQLYRYSLDLLKQRGEQKSDWPGADHMHPSVDGSFLVCCWGRCRGHGRTPVRAEAESTSLPRLGRAAAAFYGVAHE